MIGKINFGIRADIGETETKLELMEDGRNLPPKVVSTQDFVQALRTVKLDEQKEETPLLPGDFGTKKVIKRSNGNYVLLFTTPPGETTITYNALRYLDLQVYSEEHGWEQIDLDSSYQEEAKEELQAYFREESFDPNDGEGEITFYNPSMVWMLELRPRSNDMYRVVRDRIYAKESVIFSLEDTLYASPLGNIYSSDNVCWGGVTVPELTLQGASAYHRLFLNNYFNTDLDAENRIEFDLNGFTFTGRVLHLLKNQEILQSKGSEEAQQHMVDVIKNKPKGKLGDLWNEFTQ